MSRLYRFGLLMLAAAVIGYFFRQSQKIETQPNQELSAQSSESEELTILDTTSRGKITPLIVDTSNRDSRFIRYKNGIVHLKSPIKKSRDLNTLSQTPDKDLEILDELFASYRTVFKANPVGSENSEFISALLGDNSKKIVFMDPESPHLQNGELVDRWGHPYYFHPVSAIELEIHSLGPDGKLGTIDDIKL